MALAAKISAAELSAQVTNRFQDQYFEARLIDSPTSYTPGQGVDDASFLANEVAIGTGGYARQTFFYSVADIATYSDGGVGLSPKATVFAHDGGATAIDFTHVALVWSTDNATSVSTNPTAAPSGGVDGTYYGIPMDSTNGSGVGLTVNITVANSGLTAGDYTIALVSPGYGFSAADTVTITDATLASIGAITGGAGDLTFTVDTVHTAANAGQLLAVSQTTNPVSLIGGYEAVFYWNLKQYGYYESLLAVTP